MLAHLITVELGKAVRTASGRPNPTKYGQFFSMRAILWCTIQPTITIVQLLIHVLHVQTDAQMNDGAAIQVNACRHRLTEIIIFIAYRILYMEFKEKTVSNVQ